MDAAAEIGRNPVSKHQIQPASMEMSKLTRDGTAELVSRDQILRRERGQGIFCFPVQLTTNRISNLTLLLLYVLIIHTLILLLLYAISNIVFSKTHIAAPRWTSAGAAPLFHTPPSSDTSISQLCRS